MSIVRTEQLIVKQALDAISVGWLFMMHISQPMRVVHYVVS